MKLAENRINDHSVCYGKPVTFLKLRQSNITGTSLLFRSAPVDVIDRYEIYLHTVFDPNSTLNNQTFCRCDEPWFGPNCDYVITTNKKFILFRQVVHQQFCLKGTVSTSNENIIQNYNKWHVL